MELTEEEEALLYKAKVLEMTKKFRERLLEDYPARRVGAFMKMLEELTWTHHHFAIRDYIEYRVCCPLDNVEW